MKKPAKHLAVVLVVIATFCLTACERIVSGDERTAVLAFSEPAVDNLLAGWMADDYVVFSRDFNADLQEEIPAADFPALKQELGRQFGNYNSRSIERVARSDEFYVVDYQAKFEQGEPVKITVAFQASDHSIAFLSFESATVSWSTFQ